MLRTHEVAKLLDCTNPGGQTLLVHQHEVPAHQGWNICITAQLLFLVCQQLRARRDNQ